MSRSPREDGSRMDLSVVIVNWNSGNFLKQSLEALSPLQAELAEVVVADNASGDSSFEAARLDWVRLVRFASNLGFAGAANRAISTLESSFVLLLNPDVFVETESVCALLSLIQDKPEVAVICGRLMGPEGKSQERFQIRRLPDWWSILCDVLFFEELFDLLRPVRPTPPEATECRPVEQPAAAFWIVRRKAWEDLEGFDERFHPAWFEDVDFCRRLQEKGWVLLFCPGHTARHRGAVSVDRLGRRRFLKTYYGNLLKYIRKHNPYGYPFLWLPVKLGTWIRLLRVSE